MRQTRDLPPGLHFPLQYEKASNPTPTTVSAFAVLPVYCGYCNRPAALVPSTRIYGREYGGPRWWCQDCDAHVGCHPGTDTPLGSLANAELRTARQRAHAVFDPLWKNGKLGGRSWLYGKLAEYLGIPVKDTHIGCFDIPTCRKVIAFCRLYQ